MIPRLIGIPLVLILTTGCPEKDRYIPREEDFRSLHGMVAGTYMQGRIEGYIRDLDGDGRADAITGSGRAYWVASGYENHFRKYDRIMSEEMREAATASMQSDQRLAYLMACAAYEEERPFKP